MNGFDLDALTPSERSAIQADAAALCADPSLGVALKYRQRATPSRNFATGAVTESFTTHSVYVVKAPTENDEGSGAQLGAVSFLASASLFESLEITPGASDELVDGSIVYQVLSAERDPIGALWRFECRREGVLS